MLTRRVFLGSLTGGLLAAPLAAEGQQAGKVHRIGYLTVPSRESAQGAANTFQLGLHELGWVAGQNVVVDYRFADNNMDRLRDRAADLVRLNADVIVAGASAAVMAVKNETRTIPIVMFLAIDPVGSGLVASLARPGGTSPGLPRPPGRRSTASNCSCSKTPFHVSRESRFS